MGFFRKLFKKLSPSRLGAKIKAKIRTIKAKPKKVKAVKKPRNVTEAPKVDKSSGLNASSWASSGEWQQVSSSNVSAIRYDSGSAKLYVEFLGEPYGSVYRYEGVSKQTAMAMFNAASMGKFVHQHLKNKYPYHKVQ